MHGSYLFSFLFFKVILSPNELWKVKQINNAFYSSFEIDFRSTKEKKMIYRIYFLKGMKDLTELKIKIEK